MLQICSSPSLWLEQFWELVKGKVKCHKLEDTEILQNRTIDAANEFPNQHLQNIIQYSKDHFLNCLNRIYV